MSKVISDQQSFLECRNITHVFSVKYGKLWKRNQGYIQAVKDVSLVIKKGETFGLVGESGCGKSTLSKVIVGLLKPSGGDIFFHGQPFLVSKRNNIVGHKIQMVFQDPFSSLNPRLSIFSSISESLVTMGVHKKERKRRVEEILHLVGMQPEHAIRYPHEFSGGQRQRIAIARALITHPELLVCDEAVSALDTSVQAQVLNLLKDLQSQFGLTYFFISHDIAVVGYMSNRVAVMYLGRIVELGSTDSLLNNPAHPYTQLLLNAVPIPDPCYRKEKIVLKGEAPSSLSPPSGCPFHTQCPYTMEICKKKLPNFIKIEKTKEGNVEDRFIRCHLYK